MTIRTVILGATGYVGGELLRLLATHPEFKLAAAVSANHAGKNIGSVFPHLEAAYAGQTFLPMDDWSDMFDRGDRLAIFSAAAHGASAALVQRALGIAESKDLDVHVVDSSADFRYSNVKEYAAIYGAQHPAGDLLKNFSCAVPEHCSNNPTPHVSHPGCFATATLLAAVPLYQNRMLHGDLFVSGITGSTGSGRSAQPGTHHPERHSNLYAYKPLRHRHAPEVENLIENATGHRAQVNFVPHSGPFARGIYVTLQATLASEINNDDLLQIFANYYADAEFVQLRADTPKLKQVVASNYAQIGVSTSGKSVVVMCAIDNLVKGAAGGAVQWMNRLWSLPETSGLTTPPPAWT